MCVVIADINPFSFSVSGQMVATLIVSFNFVIIYILR